MCICVCYVFFGVQRLCGLFVMYGVMLYGVLSELCCLVLVCLCVVFVVFLCDEEWFVFCFCLCLCLCVFVNVRVCFICGLLYDVG